MVVFIKSNKELTLLAEQIGKALSLPGGELRYGLNIGGGDYYRFDTCGLEICLIRNQGEVEREGAKEYQYYLELFSTNMELKPDKWFEFVDIFCEYVSHTLRQSKIDAVAEKRIKSG
jgi:hypothetical protein